MTFPTGRCTSSLKTLGISTGQGHVFCAAGCHQSYRWKGRFVVVLTMLGSGESASMFPEARSSTLHDSSCLFICGSGCAVIFARCIAAQSLTQLTSVVISASGCVLFTASVHPPHARPVICTARGALRRPFASSSSGCRGLTWGEDGMKGPRGASFPLHIGCAVGRCAG